MSYKPWSAGPTEAPRRPLDRPVLVDLAKFYGAPDPSSTAPISDDPAPGGYLQINGRVPGLLKRWRRALNGQWLAQVDFSVCDAYGAVQVRHEGALVPAEALVPQDPEPRR